jgi:hypothetical protein
MGRFPPFTQPCSCLGKVPHLTIFSRALLCLDSGRQKQVPECLGSARLVTVEVPEYRLMVVSSSSSMSLVLLYLACILIPAEMPVRCAQIAREAACLPSDTSGNQALRGILNSLSLQAAREASDSSSCMERPGPSPLSLYSECQVSLAEGKSRVSGWAVCEQLLKYPPFTDPVCICLQIFQSCKVGM